MHVYLDRAKTFRKSFVKNALDIAKVNPMSLCETGKEIKTAMCVGLGLNSKKD